MTQDVRLGQLIQWVHAQSGWTEATLEPASTDASFRRYFRAYRNGQTAIAMDAPPDKENSAPFIDITKRLREAGVHAPDLYAQNLLDGFLLLEDFGSTHLLDELNLTSVDELYGKALDALLQIQHADVDHLPEFTPAFMRMELDIMPEWFLQKHLGLNAEELPHELLEQAFDFLLEEVSNQPVAFMHRDYHSRNLMLAADGSLGVIDYQGALLGPVTYDLASLLRDCYIAWPQQRVEQWACQFRREAIAAGTIPPIDEYTFMRWFDLTGLQRHLKVLGIFARLYHRDGKGGYLHDLPRVLSYVLLIGERYPEIAPLIAWLRQQGVVERIGTVVIPA